MKTAYFSDYNEDQMQTYNADSDLVLEYEIKSDKAERPIITFKNKTEMNKHVREFGHQARHGVQQHRYLPRKEMRELIDQIDEKIEEIASKPTKTLEISAIFTGDIKLSDLKYVLVNKEVKFKRV